MARISDLTPFLIKTRRFSDHRGFFEELYSYKDFKKTLNVDVEWKQDNHSVSFAEGTVRGMHFQAPPHAQAKLVRCGRGAIFDVAVDIRIGSPSFGDWFGLELSEENCLQLFIPPGFAHGFLTLEPNSEILYKCSDYYTPSHEGSLRWNDTDVGIEWPLNGDAILNEKDEKAPFLKELQSPFTLDEKL